MYMYVCMYVLCVYVCKYVSVCVYVCDFIFPCVFAHHHMVSGMATAILGGVVYSLPICLSMTMSYNKVLRRTGQMCTGVLQEYIINGNMS